MYVWTLLCLWAVISSVDAKSFYYVNTSSSYNYAETICNQLYVGLLFNVFYAYDEQRELVKTCVPEGQQFWVENDINIGNVCATKTNGTGKVLSCSSQLTNASLPYVCETDKINLVQDYGRKCKNTSGQTTFPTTTAVYSKTSSPNIIHTLYPVSTTTREESTTAINDLTTSTTEVQTASSSSPTLTSGDLVTRAQERGKDSGNTVILAVVVVVIVTVVVAAIIVSVLVYRWRERKKNNPKRGSWDKGGIINPEYSSGGKSPQHSGSVHFYEIPINGSSQKNDTHVYSQLSDNQSGKVPTSKNEHFYDATKGESNRKPDDHVYNELERHYTLCNKLNTSDEGVYDKPDVDLIQNPEPEDNGTYIDIIDKPAEIVK